MRLKLLATGRRKMIFGVAVLIVGATLAMVGASVIRNGSATGETTTLKPINLLADGWGYMPGTIMQQDGLHVSYVGQAIVRQDGSAGLKNPPINLYGTHLQSTGDVTVRATMKDLKGIATLRLYATVPVVEDEFRIEPQSLQIALSDKHAEVTTWAAYRSGDIYQQKSASTQTIPVGLQSDNVVELARKNNQWSISLNGKALGVNVAKGVLAGDLWFGMTADAPGDSWTLASLTASPRSSRSATTVNTQTTPVTRDDAAQSLQQAATKKRSGFLVGAAVSLAPTVADAQYQKLAFGGNFGSITTENALKWQFIHPEADVYDFKQADALVDMATKNGLKIHGHTLVFGEANPDWIQSLPTATDEDKAHVRQVMLDHIAKTVGHFKGKIYSWDVVNEPLQDYDDDTVGPREHIWYKAMGSSYIAQALAAAHQADPKAKLYINDYGLEEDGHRWDAMLALAKQLKSQGVPLDGIGFEAHVYQKGDEIDSEVLKSHIHALADLGLTARISEMDVHKEDGTAAQAKQYADVFRACVSEPACVSWTTWGVTDTYDLFLDDNNSVVRGEDLLWDAQSKPTPALAAMLKTLH